MKPDDAENDGEWISLDEHLKRTRQMGTEPGRTGYDQQSPTGGKDR